MATKQTTSQQPSLGGRLLIASPYADESPYRRSLVLLLKHDADGAVGIILDEMFAESLQQLRGIVTNGHLSKRQGMSQSAGIPAKLARWSPGQLESEVEQGVWLHIPAEPDRFLREGVPPWHSLVREAGRNVYRDALGIQTFPEHVWMN